MNMNINKSFVWIEYRWSNARNGKQILSVCPRAAVATDVAYHHRYDCVCMNDYWTLDSVKRLRVFREALYKIELIDWLIEDMHLDAASVPGYKNNEGTQIQTLRFSLDGVQWCESSRVFWSNVANWSYCHSEAVWVREIFDSFTPLVWNPILYWFYDLIQTVFVVNKLNRRNFWKKRIKSLCGQCQGLWCLGGAFIEISLEMSSTTQWLNMCSEGIMADETRQWRWGWGGGGECTPSQRQRL